MVSQTRLPPRSKAQLPLLGNGTAHAAARQIAARGFGIAALSAHELDMVELRRFFANGLQALAFAARRRSTTDIVGQLDMGTVGKFAHRFGKCQILGLHHKTECIPACPAAEAMPQLRGGIDFQRGGFLVMQRAAAPEIATALAHRSAFANKRHDIGRFAHLLDIVIADDGRSPPFLPAVVFRSPV